VIDGECEKHKAPPTPQPGAQPSDTREQEIAERLHEYYRNNGTPLQQVAQMCADIRWLLSENARLTEERDAGRERERRHVDRMVAAGCKIGLNCIVNERADKAEATLARLRGSLIEAQEKRAHFQVANFELLRKLDAAEADLARLTQERDALRKELGRG
jgi:hypothetical protein